VSFSPLEGGKALAVDRVLSVSLRRDGLDHIGSDPGLWGIDEETLRC
jgi:hypothetical protein